MGKQFPEHQLLPPIWFIISPLRTSPPVSSYFSFSSLPWPLKENIFFSTDRSVFYKETPSDNYLHRRIYDQRWSPWILKMIHGRIYNRSTILESLPWPTCTGRPVVFTESSIRNFPPFPRFIPAESTKRMIATRRSRGTQDCLAVSSVECEQMGVERGLFNRLLIGNVSWSVQTEGVTREEDEKTGKDKEEERRRPVQKRLDRWPLVSGKVCQSRKQHPIVFEIIRSLKVRSEKPP